MKTRTALLLSLAGVSLFSGSAMAADPVAIPAPVVMAPAPPAPTVAAYVEVFFGYDFGREIYTGSIGDYEEFWRGFGFGGAGRAAWQVRPNLSMQLDVWAQHWSGRYERYCEQPLVLCTQGTWDANDIGIGTHLTFLTGGGLQVGALMSVGSWNGDVMGNVGVEAQTGGDRFRIYGQAGFVFGLAGAIVADEVRDIYAALVATFYPRPTIALSANVGADRYVETGFEQRQLTWGARAEMQLGDNPLSIFVAYQGWHWSEDFLPVGTAVGTEHAFGVGISLLVGQPDLRSRDRAVGLADNNPLYGQTFVH